jgi:predicted GIY-YIG superfamily endonuclease
MKDRTVYIYFIQSGYGAIKVGMAKNPEKRLANMQTSIPKSLRLLAAIPLPDRKSARALERELHDLFKDERIRGEWFNRRIVKKGKMKEVFGGTLKQPYFKGWVDA